MRLFFSETLFKCDNPLKGFSVDWTLSQIKETLKNKTGYQFRISIVWQYINLYPICTIQNNSCLVPNTKHISLGGLSCGRRRFYHPESPKSFEKVIHLFYRNTYVKVFCKSSRNSYFIDSRFLFPQL